MATQTLADLRQRVRSWSNRRDLEDDLLDDFLNIAQARLNRTLRIPPLESEVSILVEGDSALLPRDYIEAVQLTYSTGTRTFALERKDISMVEERVHNQGTPKYFGRRGNNFKIAPIPEEGSSIKLYYYVALQPLVEDEDTNWFTSDAPEVLVYGALSELALYVRDEIGAAQWETKFQASALEIQKMADDAQWSGDTLSITL